MNLDYTDITRGEAAEIEEHLNGMYPSLGKERVQSKAIDVYFQDHWMLFSAAGIILAGAWYNHKRLDDLALKRLRLMI